MWADPACPVFPLAYFCDWPYVPCCRVESPLFLGHCDWRTRWRLELSDWPGQYGFSHWLLCCQPKFLIGGRGLLLGRVAGAGRSSASDESAVRLSQSEAPGAAASPSRARWGDPETRRRQPRPAEPPPAPRAMASGSE